MKRIPFLFLILLVVACTTENQQQSNENSAKKQETVKKVNYSQIADDYFTYQKDVEELTFKNVQVYPILASDQYIADHEGIGNILTLKEALSKNAIRITEKNGSGSARNSSQSRPIGGSVMNNPLNPDNMLNNIDFSLGGGAVNTLEARNMSSDPILLMAGDVVTGGKQDRVVGEDQIIAGNNRGRHDVSVFCVEAGRWSPKTTAGGSQVYAFTGYFNVASNKVRKTAKETKDQSQVWASVDEVTNANGASSETKTYANLQNSRNYTRQQEQYIEHFKTILGENDRVVGIMVASGDEMLGCDIFCTNDLFKKSYEALLHAYITDAMSFGSAVNVEEATVEAFFQDTRQKYSKSQGSEKDKELKYKHNGRIVHFTNL